MSKENNQALLVHAMTVHYNTTPVLWDINLSVPQGKMVGIIGPNGAGKSTFMKAALGLVKPVSGIIKIKDKPVCAARKKVAYVPQRESIDWDFPITVEELVLMGKYAERGMFKKFTKHDYEEVRVCLEKVGMGPYAKRQISQLSGGQQQRAFLARALVQNADIYFLDEPLAGVDQLSEGIILELLHALRDSGKTIFMVHHDLNSVKKYFDWVILLNVRLIACDETSKAFTPENIQRAYGKGLDIFDETMKISQSRAQGIS